jgi:secretion/DNA translocation related TadE-like protein
VTGSRDEAGYGTVLGLSLAMVFLAVAGAVATLGAVSVTRHQAEATADVVALAAAGHAWEGQDAACRAARRLSDQHHASLLECRLDGLDAYVVVGVRAPGRLSSLGLVHGRARGGRR